MRTLTSSKPSLRTPTNQYPGRNLRVSATVSRPSAVAAAGSRPAGWGGLLPHALVVREGAEEPRERVAGVPGLGVRNLRVLPEAHAELAVAEAAVVVLVVARARRVVRLEEHVEARGVAVGQRVDADLVVGVGDEEAVEAPLAREHLVVAGDRGQVRLVARLLEAQLGEPARAVVEAAVGVGLAVRRAVRRVAVALGVLAAAVAVPGPVRVAGGAHGVVALEQRAGRPGEHQRAAVRGRRGHHLVVRRLAEEGVRAHVHAHRVRLVLAELLDAHLHLVVRRQVAARGVEVEVVVRLRGHLVRVRVRLVLGVPHAVEVRVALLALAPDLRDEGRPGAQVAVVVARPAAGLQRAGGRVHGVRGLRGVLRQVRHGYLAVLAHVADGVGRRRLRVQAPAEPVRHRPAAVAVHGRGRRHRGVDRLRADGRRRDGERGRHGGDRARRPQRRRRRATRRHGRPRSCPRDQRAIGRLTASSSSSSPPR